MHSLRFVRCLKLIETPNDIQQLCESAVNVNGPGGSRRTIQYGDRFKTIIFNSAVVF